MLEKNYKFLLWIYIFWFLGSVLLVSLHIIPPELTAVQSLFLVFTGVFAAVFFIMQYGKWLGSAITLLIFVVSTCIEWMQLSYTDEYIGSTLGGSVTEFLLQWALFGSEWLPGRILSLGKLH